LPTTYARRPIKCSKDADFRLVCFLKKKHIASSCGWDSGPDDVGQTCPYCDVTHKNSNTKLSNF